MKNKNIKLKGNIIKNKKAVHIFHCDLRLIDNTALYKLIKKSDLKIYPVYIKDNFYNSRKQRLITRILKKLDIYLKKNMNSKIHYLEDFNELINFINTKKINILSWNLNYSISGLRRDKILSKISEKFNLDVNRLIDDEILVDSFDNIKNTRERNYRDLNAFKKHIEKIKNSSSIRKAKINKIDKKYFTKVKGYQLPTLEKNDKDYLYPFEMNFMESIWLLNKIDTFSKNTSDFSIYRFYLTVGILSSRLLYQSNKNDKIRNNIVKLNFYYYLSYHNYNCLNITPNLKKIKCFRNRINYDINKSKKLFYVLKKSKTGFPLIDALNKALLYFGYLDDSGREMLGNFISKTLNYPFNTVYIYFKNNLCDFNDFWDLHESYKYRSCGTYIDVLRASIYNPWKKSKEYDKNANFIKKWLPNLKELKPSDIHNWNNNFPKYDLKEIGYFQPIIDFSKRYNQFIKEINKPRKSNKKMCA